MTYTLGVVIGTGAPYLVQDLPTYGELLTFVAEMAMANLEEALAGADTVWNDLVPLPYTSSLALRIAGQERVAVQTWQLDSENVLTLIGAFPQSWKRQEATEFSPDRPD